jgi:hypothetical protein
MTQNYLMWLWDTRGGEFYGYGLLDVVSWSYASQGAVKSLRVEQGCAETQLHNITILNDCRRGFGSQMGFMDHMKTRLVAILNDSAHR